MEKKEGLYVHIDEVGVIVAADPITVKLKTALHHSYQILHFQIISEKPILCVCIPARDPNSRDVPGESAYPVLYPGTIIIPEDCWGDFEVENHAILLNEMFISACLDKPSFEVTFTDLLGVFEILTDEAKLIGFGDKYGLIIGGVECERS